MFADAVQRLGDFLGRNYVAWMQMCDVFDFADRVSRAGRNSNGADTGGVAGMDFKRDFDLLGLRIFVLGDGDFRLVIFILFQ